MELTLPLTSSDKRGSRLGGIVVAVTLWVACAFSEVPARLVTDLTIPSGYSLPSGFIHIKGTSSFQVMFLRANSNFGNDGALLLYDSTAANTSIIPLTANIYHDVGSGGPEIGIVSNTVVIIGTATGAVLPNVIRHNLYQFTLGNQSPLPTSATLVTNFAFGATNLFGQPRITELTNGGMLIAENEEMTQNTLSLLYMFPNTTITNYGYVTFYGASGGNFPTLGSAAQADGTVWTFGNKDAMNGTNAATQFTNYSGGISQAQSFSLVDSVGGVQTSYFEYNYPEAISDNVSNRIILCYCNPNYIQSDGDVLCRVTTVNVTGFLPNTNHYLMSQSSNMVDRVAQSAITQSGKNIVLGYFQSFTNCSEQQNGFPFYLQSFTDTEQHPADLMATAAFASTIAYHPHRLDYGLQLFDGSYHLLIFGGTVYYVRPDGNDSNSGMGNTPSQAWQHIQHADGIAVGGDIVRVQPGTYNEQPTLTASGSAGSFINYVADTNNGPVICRGFDLNGASYTRITGFEITHADLTFTGGIILDGTINHVEIIDNYIHNMNGAQAIRATTTSLPSFITFRGNTIFYPGVVYGLVTNSCPYGIAMNPVNPHHILSEYNVIQRAADVFINNYGTNCIVRNNYCFDFRNSYFNTDNNCHSDIFQDGSDGIQTGSRYHVYERNAFSDCVEINSHGGFWHDSSNFGDTNMLVRGNVGWNLGSGAIGVQCVKKVVCYNNSFYNCSLFFTFFKAGGETEFPTNPIIANCIGQLATDNVDDPFTIYAGSNPQLVAGNIAFQCAASPNVQLVANPLFNSTSANNFRLQSGSPARGFGTNVAYVTSSSGSGTTFSLNDSQLFIDGFGLVDGDTITVGKAGSPVTILSNNWGNNTITVSSSVTWTNNMPVYWGTDTSLDVGAYPYNSASLTSAALVQSGTSYTVNTLGDTRGVWFYVNGIPYKWVSARPFMTTIDSGTVTAKAYALYAQTVPVMLASTGGGGGTPPPVNVHIQFLGNIKTAGAPNTVQIK